MKKNTIKNIIVIEESRMMIMTTTITEEEEKEADSLVTYSTLINSPLSAYFE
ncbi:MAG TPA: hypothetical protein VFZ46_05640 [Nitrososphaeraceae archaeon]